MSRSPSKGQAGVDPYTVPLERIDVSDSELYETDTHWGYFERLRKEDPVHYCAVSDFGPYWSVTRYDDVVTVEKNPEIYSSQRSIVVGDPDPAFPLEAGFITMDGPKHTAHRQVVQPVASPRNLTVLEPLIRARVREILGRAPGRRDVRLGRSRLDRAHHRHAGHAVRLPLRGAPQAHLLVGHGDGQPAPGRLGRRHARRSAGRRSWSASPSSRRSGRSARAAADGAARLHHGARERRGDARHGAPGVPRHPGPPDRRRQRHDAELDLRRRPRAQREPGRVPEAARRPGPDPEHGERDHPLADAARAHAPHRDAGHGARRQVDREGRQGRDVVRVREPRRGRLRATGRVPDRPRERAPAPRLRHRRALLHGQPPRRDAASRAVGGDPRALPRGRGRRAAAARALELRQGLREPARAGPAPGERGRPAGRSRPGAPPPRRRARPTSRTSSSEPPSLRFSIGGGNGRAPKGYRSFGRPATRLAAYLRSTSASRRSRKRRSGPVRTRSSARR